MNSSSTKSDLFRDSAQNYLVGGISSSFRINPFTGKSLYLNRANGPFIYDLDGREYIDFFMGHGACPLGHNRSEIKVLLDEILKGGFYGEYEHPYAMELARKIVEHVPSAEKVRYVNSGTEGTMLALRLARGYTGRSKIVRIDGHFHGGHDYVLGHNLVGLRDQQNPGDRLSSYGPAPAGTPQVIQETLYLIPWKRPEVFEKLANEKGSEIAALLLNPIDFNNGCIGSTSEYLQAMRDICDRHGIVLIFDEILAGFRTGISCAQGYYGVTPDLTLLGKALSNGVPLGAIAGKEEIMMKIMDPVEPVIAGGTYSGNALGSAAGVAAMRIMETPGFYEEWHTRTAGFMENLQSSFDEVGFPARVQNLGCGFYIYVGTRDPIENYDDFAKLNPELANTFFRKCIDKGVYFHTDFTVSALHDEATLSKAANLIRDAAWETRGER